MESVAIRGGFKVLYFPVLLLLACGWACSNKNALPAPAPIGPSEPLAWTPGHNVYIVGMDSGAACYWKNGVKTALTPDAEGMGISVAGSDIYVAGMRFVSGSTKAAIWKSGVEQDLADTPSTAYQVLADGGDEYVAGTLEGQHFYSQGVYWKNGQVIRLDSAMQTWAWGIAVSGGDTYVMGAIGTGTASNADTMLLWKNGVREAATYVAGYGFYQQIFFSGPDLYLVGLQGYSVNTQPFNEMAGAVQTNALCLSGSDIYVAGYTEDVEGMHAAYWKNGQLFTLPDPGGTASMATGIAFAGSDLYVIGSSGGTGLQRAVFWKNGIEATLSRGGALNQIVVE